MLTVSDALKNAFMEPERTIYVRIKIGTRTFDNDNVISVEYDSGSLSGEFFAVGSTYSNSIKITFSELVEGLKELDEVSYEIGVKLSDGTIGYVPMGIFIINDAIDMDRNNNKTTIECMDKMIMMGGTYVSSLTYPAAIREVALEIANKAAVQVEITSFERLSADKIAKPEGYTYREAIGLIAQFEAGFATFNRFGKLEIRTLSDPTFAIPPDNYFSKGLVKNEVFFRLGGISCTTDDGDTIIQSGNSAGNQVVLENRVMTKILLDKIYQKIQTINYYPFSLSWQGNPVIEAGDWVEVEDLQGNKFKTPNLSYSLSFNGGLSAKSNAETATQSDVTYQYKSPLQQKIEWIHARIDAAGGNVVYEGIDEPANPKEGDLWFKIIGPDKEILIYKKDKDGNLFWEPQISTADIDKVAREVEAIIKKADEDRIKVEQDISQAVTDAKAYTEIKAQEFDNQMIIVNQDLVIAKQSADTAVTKANQAVVDAGFAKVDAAAATQLFYDMSPRIETAFNNANLALIDAGDAYWNAEQALNKATALETTTGNLATNYNALTQTVGLKADKSVVSVIDQTVSKHTLDIAANAEGLKYKADSSFVDTIKGTVDTHTNQISVNSQAINARLTSAQVETLLTGKKYVNETTLAATSNGLNLAITKVSTDLSNLEIGGRNLLLNTANLERSLSSTNISLNVMADTPAVMIQGEEYTLSFDLKADNYTTSDRVFLNGGLIIHKTFEFPTEWERQYVTFVYNGGNYANQQIFPHFYPGGSMMKYVKRFKLEKGNKATDWSPASEDMATLEQFTTIDATVNGLITTVGNSEGKITALEIKANGLQTTVADKADKTQVTQLANQWTQTTNLVNGHTTQISSLGTQIDLRVKKGDVVSQFNIDAGRVLISTGKLFLDANTYIMGTTFANDVKAKSLEAVYADIATLKTRVLTTDVITSTMLKSDTALIDKIFANDANVNRLTAKTAFINSVKAIDIAADRITTGNLNAAKVAIINLDASRIVSGTISGITITSPFDYLYSGTTRNRGTTTIASGEISMNGTFTNSYGSTYLKLNADGLYGDNLMSNGSVRSLFKINGDGLTVVAGNSTAYYRQDGIYFESGGNASIKYYSANARIEVGSYNGVSLGTTASGTFYNRLTVGGGQDGIDPFVDVWTPLNLRGNPILLSRNTSNRIVEGTDNAMNVLSPQHINFGWTNGNITDTTIRVSQNETRFYKKIYFNDNQLYGMANINDAKNILFGGGANRIVQASDGQFNMLTHYQINLGWTNGTTVSNVMSLTNNQIVAFRTLNMNGNSISNQSDRRLKKNITNASDDSLGAINNWNFVNYEWINSDSESKKGRHLGLIAQETPELLMYDAQNDVYNINSSKQTMMNSHAIQQLNQKVVSIETIAHASNALVGQALSETAQLRLKVEELENKIQQLESAA